MKNLAVVGLVTPCKLAFMTRFGVVHKKMKVGDKIGLFSIAVFVITVISGIATAAFVNSNYQGLLERITKGSTIVCIEVVAVKLFFNAKCQLRNHKRDQINLRIKIYLDSVKS